MSKEILYRISFINDAHVYEIYAVSVGESDMFGFIEIEDIVFGESSSVVVDPSEEKLKSEFSGVNRTYIPMSSVIRIDQVNRQGQAKVHEHRADAPSKISHFPSPLKNK